LPGWNLGATPAASYSPVEGDFNGDGLWDMVLLGNSTVLSLQSVSDGTFLGTTSNLPNGWALGLPPSGTYSIVAGDVDGDHRLDITVIGGSVVRTLLSLGNGAFAGR
jgi:hypothetical protein